MAKTREPDYTLNIFHAVDKESKKASVAFLVQTTKVFVSFQYDVLFQIALEERTITLTVKGLHAPESLMPGSGPARGWKYLEKLSGRYKLVVRKQDKAVNEFDIDVAKSSVTLLKSPENSFIIASTDPVALN